MKYSFIEDVLELLLNKINQIIETNTLLIP